MKKVIRGFSILAAALLVMLPAEVRPQGYETKWLSAGSLHNWYANMGCEIEEGRFKRQQDGLQWPAIYQYQDMQAAKGMWIGTTNFTDQDGTVYPHKVIGVGPRFDGKNVLFPTKFELVSKFDPPTVYVDGNLTEGKSVEVNRIDPTIKADRMIVNELNTSIGLSMRRTIMQWSQPYHDNYHIIDYRFTNTSGKVLDSVVIYFQYRLSVCADTRYVIGNATGWGINAMLDSRGDGVKNDADDAVDVPGVYSAPHMRIQYVWHGKYPSFTLYDNIGGPIWTPYYDATDTTGRLGAAQFVGVATLHADRSAADSTDDFGQPFTTSYEGSDEGFTSPEADMFNGPRMTAKYTQWMSRGHRAPRHADVVEPDGDFRVLTGDPALGTPGGFSNANGYGPYRIAPGEDIHIVLAEGAAGLSRERCVSIGRRFKLGQITAPQKNDSVYTGRDSLFLTFRRALANFKSGYNIAAEPLPPKNFTVTSAGDKIGITWEVYNPSDPNLKGFRLYRAVTKYDSAYHLVTDLPATARGYDDTQVTRGEANYYYLVAYGDASQNTGAGLTPLGELTSNRYYAQTFDPAFLKRQPGESMSDIRIVPNPFHLGSDPTALRFGGEPDKIAFLNIPGYCTIRIYTELGELIKEMEHTDGSGDHYWNSTTSSNQVVASGVYIVVIENTRTGERTIKKFVVIR